MFAFLPEINFYLLNLRLSNFVLIVFKGGASVVFRQAEKTTWKRLEQA